MMIKKKYIILIRSSYLGYKNFSTSCLYNRDPINNKFEYNFNAEHEKSIIINDNNLKNENPCLAFATKCKNSKVDNHESLDKILEDSLNMRMDWHSAKQDKLSECPQQFSESNKQLIEYNTSDYNNETTYNSEIISVNKTTNDINDNIKSITENYNNTNFIDNSKILDITFNNTDPIIFQFKIIPYHINESFLHVLEQAYNQQSMLLQTLLNGNFSCLMLIVLSNISIFINYYVYFIRHGFELYISTNFELAFDRLQQNLNNNYCRCRKVIENIIYKIKNIKHDIINKVIEITDNINYIKNVKRFLENNLRKFTFKNKPMSVIVLFKQIINLTSEYTYYLEMINNVKKILIKNKLSSNRDVCYIQYKSLLGAQHETAISRLQMNILILEIKNKGIMLNLEVTSVYNKLNSNMKHLLFLNNSIIVNTVYHFHNDYLDNMVLRTFTEDYVENNQHYNIIQTLPYNLTREDQTTVVPYERRQRDRLLSFIRTSDIPLRTLRTFTSQTLHNYFCWGAVSNNNWRIIEQSHTFYLDCLYEGNYYNKILVKLSTNRQRNWNDEISRAVEDSRYLEELNPENLDYRYNEQENTIDIRVQGPSQYIIIIKNQYIAFLERYNYNLTPLRVSNYKDTVPITLPINPQLGFVNDWLENIITTYRPFCIPGDYFKFPYEQASLDNTMNVRSDMDYYYIFDLIQNSNAIHEIFIYIRSNLPRIHSFERYHIEE